mmetsp:Transcript_4215/g.8333  ORF Transcript_4215/g.8333 Transcript_4215/m.8333 type:complete len:81 (-) Transcript_4215:353-595(-)
MGCSSFSLHSSSLRHSTSFFFPPTLPYLLSEWRRREEEELSRADSEKRKVGSANPALNVHGRRGEEEEEQREGEEGGGGM